MIHTDYSLLWMFLFAAAAVAAVAAFEWWRKKNSRPEPERDFYTDGLNQMLAGKLPEAVLSFAEAARRNPDQLDAFLKLGSLLRQLGKPRRASQIHLDLSIRTDLPPFSLAAVYRELALDLEQLGSFNKALRYLDKSRTLDAANGDDLVIRQRIFEKQGKYKEAGEALRKYGATIGKQDNTRLALIKLEEGLALQANGKGHDARLLYKEAIKTDPGALESNLFIAASYIGEERTDDAFDWLTKFIKAAPEQAHDALPLLEGLLFDLGRFDEVEVILREALEKAPANISLAHALIGLKTKKGEGDDALELCERALEFSPNDFSLKIRRLALLRKRGASKEFDRQLEQVADTLIPVGEGYVCRKCGYRTDYLRIHCPGCGSWRSFSGDRRASG